MVKSLQLKILVREIPWLSAVLFVFVLLVSWLSLTEQPIKEALWYSRDGLVQGELWRLFSGHFVHHNVDHLVSDMFVFLMLALVIEAYSGKKSLSLLCLSLSAGISIGLFIAAKDMTYFAGISAINYGLLTYIILNNNIIRHVFNNRSTHEAEPSALRACCQLFIVLLLVSHCGYQLWQGSSLFSNNADNASIVIAWQAHFAGIVLVVAGRSIHRILSHRTGLLPHLGISYIDPKTQR